MIGSAFVSHNGEWVCSNEVTIGMYSTPVLDANNKPIALKEEQVITLSEPFGNKPKIDELCDVVFMNDDNQNKFSFLCKVKGVGEKQLILNILSKTDKVSEILSNITFKN